MESNNKAIIAHEVEDNALVIIPWDKVAIIEGIVDEETNDLTSSLIYLNLEFMEPIKVNEKPMKLYRQVYGDPDIKDS